MRRVTKHAVYVREIAALEYGKEFVINILPQEWRDANVFRVEYEDGNEIVILRAGAEDTPEFATLHKRLLAEGFDFNWVNYDHTTRTAEALADDMAERIFGDGVKDELKERREYHERKFGERD